MSKINTICFQHFKYAHFLEFCLVYLLFTIYRQTDRRHAIAIPRFALKVHRAVKIVFAHIFVNSGSVYVKRIIFEELISGPLYTMPSNAFHQRKCFVFLIIRNQ